ncbi:MAG: ATP-dependent metallopeptidase FtsH/Yme1/Tma family protein, partial [Clostridia bacterium]|nr:ATP-dependent metallopeptidase FtsH/Yme1/Tma family protein [Clostridia bacterium]
MKKHLKGLGFYAILLLIIITIFTLTSMPETGEQYIYSDLLTMIKEGRVAELQVVSTDANV